MQAFLIVACNRSEPDRLTLGDRKVERVDGCHIYMDSWNAEAEPRWAGLMFACDVPETARNETQWWGNQPHPLAFNMQVGECLLLGETFYCLEKIAPGQATFKASYKWANRHHDRMKPVR